MGMHITCMRNQVEQSPVGGSSVMNTVYDGCGAANGAVCTTTPYLVTSRAKDVIRSEQLHGRVAGDACD